MENSNLMNENKQISMFNNIDLILEDLGEIYDKAILTRDFHKAKKIMLKMKKYFA